MDSQAPAYLKELVAKGWGTRLTNLFLQHLQKREASADAASACAFALETVAVNEQSCTEISSLGCIESTLAALQQINMMSNVVFVRRMGGLLAALARSDKNKELIAHGIPTYSTAMIKHATEHTVQKSLLTTMTAICLRQPEIADQIVREKGT